MPIELGPIERGLTRAVAVADARLPRAPGRPLREPAQPGDSEPAVVRSEALDAGEAPLDTERVTQIRHAIEDGTYPVIPARIADAIIAAGILLRSGK